MKRPLKLALFGATVLNLSIFLIPNGLGARDWGDCQPQGNYKCICIEDPGETKNMCAWWETSVNECETHAECN